MSPARWAASFEIGDIGRARGAIGELAPQPDHLHHRPDGDRFAVAELVGRLARGEAVDHGLPDRVRVARRIGSEAEEFTVSRE